MPLQELLLSQRKLIISLRFYASFIGYQFNIELFLKYSYKGLNGLAPAYISELLRYCTSSRLLRSASQRLLSIPRTSLKTYGDRAFSPAGPKLWNELPFTLRSSNTLAVFKEDLKTYLFKLAFS